MSRYGITAISLNGTQYPGTVGYQYDQAMEIESEGSDGTVYETAHHGISRRPVAELMSRSLKAVIAALNDSSDTPIKALNGSTGLVMYGQQASSSGPGFASGTAHPTKTGLNGLIYATGIRWSAGGKAELALRAMFKSTNGSAAAVAEAPVLATLPTQPAPDFGFALTALTLNGAAITSVNSIEATFDPKAEFEFTTGLPEPTDVICAGVTGRMSHRLVADIGDIAIGSGTGSVSAVFTRYAIGGGFGTDTLTLTFNAAWAVERGWGGANSQRMSRRLEVHTVYSGTTRPLTWAVA